MKQKSYREILDSIADDSLEEQASLWPQIASQLEGKTLMKTLRHRPVLAVLIALLILLALSGVAYAIGRSLGYIPGLGVVNPNTPFHVLAEPVSQTRDGVTVTVEKAVMNEGNVLLTYKIEGLTSDKASPLEALNTCFSPYELRFPSGESVFSDGSFGEKPLNGGMTFDTRDPVYGFESNIRFPVPVGVTSATFFIPCISGALSPGILPENWELPLRFIPAPPDVALTMMPVIEVMQPTQAAMPLAETSPLPAPDAGDANPLTLTKIIAGDNSLHYGDAYRHSYILFGELNPPAPSQPSEWRIDWVSLDLVDSNGQTVYWQIPNDIDQPVSDSPHKLVWAIIVPEFAPPLRITQTARYAISANSQETYTFEFDTGANPQPLQEWKLNTEFEFAGRRIRLTRILANPVRTGYIFSFESEDNYISGLSARIEGYPSTDHLLFPILLPGKSGSTWDFYEYYDESLPSGKLKVILSDLYLVEETKNWTLEWRP
ncbi:MAG: DUF4179 domain-containing protein [Chloroflexi bacterium]|nr:DUF4179 domain-containing protein [Chloroflexota bacterium]